MAWTLLDDGQSNLKTGGGVKSLVGSNPTPSATESQFPAILPAMLNSCAAAAMFRFVNSEIGDFESLFGGHGSG